MPATENYKQILERIPANVTLVAVSKTHTVSAIKDVYDAGCRDFGENKVQELLEKQQQLPPDIRWHLIGHLQTNKVKHVAPFVHLIHSVDSMKLLGEINKEAKRHNRKIGCLIQFHIASEESKFGFSKEDFFEAENIDKLQALENINIQGVMGMASFSDDVDLIKNEFSRLTYIFKELKLSTFKDKREFLIISMGMSSDFDLAIECGSTMIRVGTTIFGKRDYSR